MLLQAYLSLSEAIRTGILGEAAAWFFRGVSYLRTLPSNKTIFFHADMLCAPCITVSMVLLKRL